MKLWNILKWAFGGPRPVEPFGPQKPVGVRLRILGTSGKNIADLEDNDDLQAFDAITKWFAERNTPVFSMAIDGRRQIHIHRTAVALMVWEYLYED